MELHVPTGAGTWRAIARDGRLDLVDGAGRLLLAGAYARVQLACGQSYTTEGGTARLDGDALLIEAAPPGLSVRPDGEVRLAWRLTPAPAGLRVELAIAHSSPGPLAIARLDPLVAPTGWGAAPYDGLQVLQCGWQSWSFASPPVPVDQLTRPAHPTIAAPMRPPGEAEQIVSPWATRLEPPGLPGLVAGFLRAHHFLGTLAVQPAPGGGHRLTASSHTEGRFPKPGEVLHAEPLLLVLGATGHGALDAYAAAVADRTPRPAPTGWCSWYYFFADVDEAAMIRNLDVLVGARDRMPVEVVQLDDGYQTAIGDWLSLNEKFPSGLRALTDRIHAAGFQAGIWLAPFLVAEDSDVARRHAEWLVCDPAGEPVPAIFNWGVRCFALDLTHPEVLAHLRHVVETIVGPWGFDYLKIDFIYAGALAGKRHEEAATGIEAYRRGLALIREVAGDRFVLGCGAPFLPSVGLVDGMRVSPDTAPDWGHPDPQGSAPSLLNAIRSTLAHHWMHGRWWVNDPDCLIVRRGDSRLTEDEVRTWATVVMLSGGMVLLSDDLAGLEPDRAAIIPRCLPPLGVAARPLGPFVDGVPTRMILAHRGWYVAAAFNWAEAPAAYTFNPAEWPGAPACPYWLLDAWTGEAHGPLEGPVDLGPTGAHGVRLLVVRPALDHPHLVGSTLTLTGGANEVASAVWADGVLTVDLRCPGTHEGELVVAVPEGWEGAGVQRVPVRLVDAAVLRLPFKRA